LIFKKRKEKVMGEALEIEEWNQRIKSVFNDLFLMGEVLEIEEWNQRIKSVFNDQGKEYEKWEIVDSWVKSRGERLYQRWRWSVKCRYTVSI